MSSCNFSNACHVYLVLNKDSKRKRKFYKVNKIKKNKNVILRRRKKEKLLLNLIENNIDDKLGDVI